VEARSESLDPKQSDSTSGNQSREEEETRIPSKDYPGLVYLKSPTATSYHGLIRIDRFSVKAIKETADSEAASSTAAPTVLWQKEMAWSMKGFSESSWKQEVSAAGLDIVSVQEGSIQPWYFLKHAAQTSGTH
jgi:hypothetical protein